uniref:Uncharacterized protein n=1 Tax=Moniliophthora roreri TaxID=221103 RepID=A0A0W0EVJ8_MONRR
MKAIEKSDEDDVRITLNYEWELYLRTSCNAKPEQKALKQIAEPMDLNGEEFMPTTVTPTGFLVPDLVHEVFVHEFLNLLPICGSSVESSAT